MGHDYVIKFFPEFPHIFTKFLQYFQEFLNLANFLELSMLFLQATTLLTHNCDSSNYMVEKNLTGGTDSTRNPRLLTEIFSLEKFRRKHF